MGEENNRSSKSLQETGNDHFRTAKRESGENRSEKMANNCVKEQVSSDSTSDCTVGNSSRIDSELETLTSVRKSQDALVDFDESSHLLSEVPVEYSLQPIQSTEQLKEQAKAMHDKSLKSVTDTSSEIQTPVPNSISVSPVSVAKSVSSVPNLLRVKSGNNTCFTEQGKQNSLGSRPLCNRTVLKTSDGYNWRKYGQKQVKSPEGYRSYYRCTFSDCDAKKIEFCDLSNCLIEALYRSYHNHDPPQKLNCMKECEAPLPIVPTNGNDDLFSPRVCSNDPARGNKLKQSISVTNEMPETKKQDSSDSDETTEVIMEEYVDGAECIKRQKKNSAGDLDSLSEPGKKPKYVFHAAGDVGISQDGYRWRKYGQKMVKGNPHARNYYRCTSAGCPVRKHIERAVGNPNAVVITYKGEHDHSTPVPRKSDGSKISVDTNSPNSQNQWSADKEGGWRERESI